MRQIKSSLLQTLFATLIGTLFIPMIAFADSTSSIAIDEANFPDPVFREYVERNFDTSHDGFLDDTECFHAQQINLSRSSETDTSKPIVRDFTGLQYFPHLTELKFANNQVACFDTAGFNDLYLVDARGNSREIYPATNYDLSQINGFDVQRVLPGSVEGGTFDIATNTFSFDEGSSTATYSYIYFPADLGYDNYETVDFTFKAHEHAYSDWTVTQQPLVGQTGLKTRTCSGCGETETEIIPALTEPSQDSTSESSEGGSVSHNQTTDQTAASTITPTSTQSVIQDVDSDRGKTTSELATLPRTHDLPASFIMLAGIIFCIAGGVGTILVAKKYGINYN